MQALNNLDVHKVLRRHPCQRCISCTHILYEYNLPASSEVMCHMDNCLWSCRTICRRTILYVAVFRNLPIAIPDSYTTLPHFGSNAPIAIVVGGNRFAYDTLRMHADVSKVIPKMNCFRDIFGRVIAEFLQNVFCFEKRWLWLLSASVLNNSQHKVFHDKCFFFPKQNPTHPDHKSFYYPMISLGIVKTKIFSFVVQESS